MLKCPSCNEENQIGAIFCRSCGEKINIDDVRPEDLKSAAGGGGADAIIKGIKTLVNLIVFVAIVGSLVALFLDPGLQHYDEMATATDSYKTYKRRVGNLMKSNSGAFTFTQQEVTQLAKEMLFLTTADKIELVTSGGSGVIAEDVDINFIDEKTVRIAMKQRGWEKVTMYSIMDFEISVNTGGGLIFTPVGAASGKLPCPGPMMDFVKGRFQSRVENLPERYNKIETLVFQKAKGFSINGESITIQK